jgi:hypothetical protein
LLDHMERLEFIRAGLTIHPLIAERVENILPMILRAAEAIAEPETDMKTVAAERM